MPLKVAHVLELELSVARWNFGNVLVITASAAAVAASAPLLLVLIAGVHAIDRRVLGDSFTSRGILLSSLQHVLDALVLS